MKNILVITPMAAEQENMLQALNNYPNPLINSYTIRRGYVGKVYAAAATALALEEERYDLVAVIGYAAASKEFSTGDIVCPRAARYHDARVPDGLDGVSFLTDPYELEGSDDAVIYTGDSFVGKEMIEEIKERFGTPRALFDMEATAVCQIAAQRGVPAMVLKMVSDTPEKGCDADSFERFVTEHTDFAAFVEILEGV
jgi:nucleoside phosphorylase